MKKSNIVSTAKVSGSFQITLKKDIRKKLGVKTGDNVIFVEDDNGKIIILNSVNDLSDVVLRY